MYVMKAAPLSDCSTKTNFPPIYKTTPITAIPKNSLIGLARFWRCAKLLENENRRLVMIENFFLKASSAVKT